jgi:hypothetical protein
LAGFTVEDLKTSTVVRCQSTLALACFRIEVIVNDAIKYDSTLASAKVIFGDERGRTK